MLVLVRQRLESRLLFTFFAPTPLMLAVSGTVALTGCSVLASVHAFLFATCFALRQSAEDWSAYVPSKVQFVYDCLVVMPYIFSLEFYVIPS